MDSEVLTLYKNLGETPLECIERFRADNKAYNDIKMTYLGRLDPMAEGLLLVLAGNTRGKDIYLASDKSYEFEVLWGFDTDTYDILGEVTDGTGQMPKKIEERMPRLLENIRNKKVQEYPPYSSRTVSAPPSLGYGETKKPLFEWAREKRIEEIEIPQKGIKIFSIHHEDTRLIQKDELLQEIIRRVELVNGDFRQESIISTWQETLRNSREEQFFISKFKASVSSGTYIRGLAHEMGQFFEIGAIAFWIKRTRVGEYIL